MSEAIIRTTLGEQLSTELLAQSRDLYGMHFYQSSLESFLDRVKGSLPCGKVFFRTNEKERVFLNLHPIFGEQWKDSLFISDAEPQVKEGKWKRVFDFVGSTFVAIVRIEDRERDKYALTIKTKRPLRYARRTIHEIFGDSLAVRFFS